VPVYISSSRLGLPNRQASTPPLSSQVENSVCKAKRPKLFRVVGRPFEQASPRSLLTISLTAWGGDVNGSDEPLWNTAAVARTLDHAWLSASCRTPEAWRSSFRIAFSFVVILFAFFVVVLLLSFFFVVFGDSSSKGVGNDERISRKRQIYSAHAQMVRSIHEEILSSMKKNVSEQFRVRMVFLAKKHPDVISDSKAADQAVPSDGSGLLLLNQRVSATPERLVCRLGVR
jgi:hypothetical protein